MKRVRPAKRTYIPKADALKRLIAKGNAVAVAVAILIVGGVGGLFLFNPSNSTCPADIERTRAVLADSYAALQSVIDTGPRSKCGGLSASP
jgi:hypothetical protein